jgi:DNA-binding transcriptional LysR family regulator
MPTLPQLQHTRFDELAVLVEVAEAGSLTAAAKQLQVPKSTVGRAIRRLEEELGVSLVRRMAHESSLTEPGRMLATLAAPHVMALRDVSAALGRESSEAYGLLRVTTLPDIGAAILAPLLPSFLARHPRVRIEVEHTLRVVDLVKEGFDLALRPTMGRLPASSLVATKLGPMHLAFYASPAYAARRDLPKHPSELGNHDLVTFYPGNQRQLALEGPKGIIKIAIQGRVAGDDFFFLREAILAGVGISLLPWVLASPELSAGRITRVLPEYRAVGGTLHLVHAPAKPLAPKLIALRTHLLAHAPRLITPPF